MFDLLLRQVYDTATLASRPLWTLNDAELAAEPLVFPSCGHIFNMSSLDAAAGLREAYIKRAGCWSRPLPLQVETYDAH